MDPALPPFELTLPQTRVTLASLPPGVYALEELNANDLAIASAAAILVPDARNAGAAAELFAAAVAETAAWGESAAATARSTLNEVILALFEELKP